jgi:quercetin dioxygenase-like cupin family protein
MHRNETLDFGIVLYGDACLILDDSEILMTEGDVVIQRGTNHSWSNRSGKTFRITFCMMGGQLAPEISALLQKHD